MLKTKIELKQRQIDDSMNKKKYIGKSQKRELEDAVHLWLVENRLQEVRGIGEELKSRIQRVVFQNRISDLRRSDRVYGVGQQRYQLIIQWVNHYERQLPVLRRKGFPGSSEIEEKYSGQVKYEDSQIEKYLADKASLENRLVPIETELSWLGLVSESTFVNAYKNPGNAIPEINKYLLGVFPEWETVPDWFQSEVGLTENN